MEYNPDELQLLPLDDPIMYNPPPVFDFEKNGAEAQHLQDILVKKMLELGGIGLSANQIGIPFRVFTFGSQEKQITLFNPFLVGFSKEKVAMEEGCLSIPDFFLVLSRPAEVTVAFQHANGEQEVGTFKGIGARVVLHEMDHMEGMNFMQHASPMKLKMAIERFKKRQVKAARRAYAEAQLESYRRRQAEVKIIPTEVTGEIHGTTDA